MVVKYLLSGPIRIAKSFVIDPFSTHSIQTFSRVSANLIRVSLGGLVLKMDDPDHRLYEDAFMTYTLITLNGLHYIDYVTLITLHWLQTN